MPKLPAGALLVVPAKVPGKWYWECKWHVDGRAIKARLGRAHVEPRDELLEGSDGWSRKYRKARGRPDPGALTADDAAVAMRDAIKAHADRIARPEMNAAKTFGAICDEWLEEREADVKDHALKRSTLADYRSMLVRPDDPLTGRGRSDASATKLDDEGKPRQRRAHVMRAFDHRPVAAITSDEVATFERKLRTAGLSPATRRKYFVVVSMVLDHAAARRYIETNPLVARPKAKRKRSRQPAIAVYSLEVVEQIAREAGGQTGEVVRLAALTGLRQGELLGLRWADVYFAGQSITVRRTFVAGEGEDVPKSGKARTVALSDPASVVLDRVSRRERFTRKADLVFAGDTGEHVDASTLRRSYMRARDAVVEQASKDGDALPVLRFHDLRHTFGSRCAAKGIPLATIKEWMGHASIQTTMVYIHFMPQADDAARLTAAFAGPVEQVEQVETAA